jgi:hypothetical protein
MATSQQRAEVGVCADEDAFIGTGNVDDYVVGGAGESDVADVDSIISSRPRRSTSLAEESRREGISCRGAPQRQLALAHCLGGIAQRLDHILGREVGQFVEDLGDGVMPSATIATTVATGMRRPRRQGMPPIVIRSNATVTNYRRCPSWS